WASRPLVVQALLLPHREASDAASRDRTGEGAVLKVTGHVHKEWHCRDCHGRCHHPAINAAVLREMQSGRAAFSASFDEGETNAGMRLALAADRIAVARDDLHVHLPNPVQGARHHDGM